MTSREGDYDAVKKDIAAIMDQEDYDDGSAGESRLPGHVAQPLLFLGVPTTILYTRQRWAESDLWQAPYLSG